ncbi:hypothetical protein ACVWYF_004166 [Hymenobacter sp. UYAg731]
MNELLKQLDELAALREATGKPGPWTWDFRPEAHSISLMNGWDTVLDTKRWGSQGATIRMEDPENPGCLLPLHMDAVPHEGRAHHKNWALTANPARAAAAFIAAAGSLDFATLRAAPRRPHPGGGAGWPACLAWPCWAFWAVSSSFFKPLKVMKVLIACEESQAVCIAFRAAGHEAYSCDLQVCSGGRPEWHIQGDAVAEAYSGGYDLLIAHPPCTLLSKAGARHMYAGGRLNQQRLAAAREAVGFFRQLLDAPIRYKAIENPEPLRVVSLPPHSQAIQPYEHGHGYSKKTLLWLVGLPLLEPTNRVAEYVPYLPSNTGGAARGHKATPGVSRAKQRSKTFAGIANAMAAQWGDPARLARLATQQTLQFS